MEGKLIGRVNPKDIFKIFLIFVSGLMLSCSEKGNPILLKFHLEKGKSYKIFLSSEQEMTQKIGGKKQKLNQKNIFETTFDVVNDKDSITLVKVTYDYIFFEQEGPLGTVIYDSSDTTSLVLPMFQGFDALIGQSYKFRVTPKGRMIDLGGIDEMISRMLEKIDIPDTTFKNTMKKSFNEQFGEEAVKEMLEKMFDIYPDKPVKIGDSWKKRVVLNKGYPMIMDNTWRLKAIKGNIAFIEVNSTIGPNPDAPPIDMNYFKLTYDISGTQKGTMEMDVETGLVIKSRSIQHFSGKIEIEGMNQTDEKIEYPVYGSGIIKIEASEIPSKGKV